MALQAMHSKIKFKKIDLLVITSSGFIQQEFFNYIKNECVNNKDYKEIKYNMNKIYPVHCNAECSPNEALLEIFSDPMMQKRFNETKGGKQIIFYDKF
jgi:stalled ribosome rescue protein Dom34